MPTPEVTPEATCLKGRDTLEVPRRTLGGNTFRGRYRYLVGTIGGTLITQGGMLGADATY